MNIELFNQSIFPFLFALSKAFFSEDMHQSLISLLMEKFYDETESKGVGYYFSGKEGEIDANFNSPNNNTFQFPCLFACFPTQKDFYLIDYEIITGKNLSTFIVCVVTKEDSPLIYEYDYENIKLIEYDFPVNPPKLFEFVSFLYNNQTEIDKQEQKNIEV